jgi:hypothetical protein
MLTASPARIQSAGVFNSPPIIMTAGIGPAEEENHAGGR